MNDLQSEGETCLCEVSNLQNGACTKCGLPWFLPPTSIHTDQMASADNANGESTPSADCPSALAIRLEPTGEGG